jgi:hypothetical protein
MFGDWIRPEQRKERLLIIMRKKSARKPRVSRETPIFPVAPIEPAPLPPPPPRNKGLATFLHLVFSLLVIWFLAKTFMEFKGKWGFSSRPSPARSGPAVTSRPSSPAPATADKSQTGKKTSASSQPTDSSASQMDVTLEFDGIKTVRGYSAWAADGSVNPSLNKSIQGTDLEIRGVKYKSGIGTHSPSEIVFALNGKVKRFTCLVGPDTSGGMSDMVIFKVFGDGKKLYESPVLRGGYTGAVPVDLNVSGVKELNLAVERGGAELGWGHADWLDIKFEKE